VVVSAPSTTGWLSPSKGVVTGAKSGGFSSLVQALYRLSYIGNLALIAGIEPATS
jgi:hypothetical protein